jgi:hypothetical protein
MRMAKRKISVKKAHSNTFKGIKHQKKPRKLKKLLKSVKKHAAKFKKAALKRVQTHCGFLTKLNSVSTDLNKIKKLLKNAMPGEILALAEIVLNLLRRNIPLTVSQIRTLCPFRNKLREVASKRTNCEQKRKIFTNQRGGILGIIGTIISAAIPAIKGLISAFTS